MRGVFLVVDGKRISFYEFLGVSAYATQDELKAAYRAMCRRLHPDTNGGSTTAEANFKVLQNVWGRLSTPDRRREYDRTLAMETNRQISGGVVLSVRVWSPGNGSEDAATTFTWGTL